MWSFELSMLKVGGLVVRYNIVLIYVPVFLYPMLYVFSLYHFILPYEVTLLLLVVEGNIFASYKVYIL